MQGEGIHVLCEYSLLRNAYRKALRMLNTICNTEPKNQNQCSHTYERGEEVLPTFYSMFLETVALETLMRGCNKLI